MVVNGFFFHFAINRYCVSTFGSNYPKQVKRENIAQSLFCNWYCYTSRKSSLGEWAQLFSFSHPYCVLVSTLHHNIIYWVQISHFNLDHNVSVAQDYRHPCMIYSLTMQLNSISDFVGITDIIPGGFARNMENNYIIIFRQSKQINSWFTFGFFATSKYS